MKIMRDRPPEAVGMNVIAKPVLSGIIPILATPFTDCGDVDKESFIRLIESSIGDGVSGLAMFGLASEYYKLCDAERTQLTELLIGQAAGRVPVVISVTHHSREMAVKQAWEAAEMGANALMIMPPFFLAPGIQAIRRHIEAVCEAVTIPVIIQYAPLQTGMIIDVETFLAIHRERPNMTHVKVDLMPSGPLISALEEASAGSLKTMLGYMGVQLPDAVARGVAGCMPTASLNRAYVHLFDLLGKDADAGFAFRRRMLPMLNFMMQSVEMLTACDKMLLLRRRIISTAYCRAPSRALDSLQAAELERHAKDLAEWLPTVP